MLLQQQEAELPWAAYKEAMEMAVIPVISVPEEEHIFHERPPPEPVDELPPETEEPPPEPPPEIDNTLPPEETPA